MSITIREANESDILDILSLVNNELGYPEVTLDELSSRIKRMNHAGNYHIYVAVISDHVVGFIAIAQEIAIEIQTDFIRIKAMAVSASYQSKGVGSSLLRHIERIASEKDIELFTLSSSFHRLDAHRFYEHNGYNKTSFTFQKGVKRNE